MARRRPRTRRTPLPSGRAASSNNGEKPKDVSKRREVEQKAQEQRTKANRARIVWAGVLMAIAIIALLVLHPLYSALFEAKGPQPLDLHEFERSFKNVDLEDAMGDRYTRHVQLVNGLVYLYPGLELDPPDPAAPELLMLPVIGSGNGNFLTELLEREQAVANGDLTGDDLRTIDYFVRTPSDCRVLLVTQNKRHFQNRRPDVGRMVAFFKGEGSVQAPGEEETRVGGFEWPNPLIGVIEPYEDIPLWIREEVSRRQWFSSVKWDKDGAVYVFWEGAPPPDSVMCLIALVVPVLVLVGGLFMLFTEATGGRRSGARRRKSGAAAGRSARLPQVRPGQTPGASTEDDDGAEPDEEPVVDLDADGDSKGDDAAGMDEEETVAKE